MLIKYLLDTNIAIHVIKQRPVQLLERFNRDADFMAISAITYAELVFGAENSQHVARNLKTVEDFCSHLVVLEYDKAAAVHYGQIRAELKSRGQMIVVNDLHIAAHARSQGLTCVTNNTREFRRVSALKVEDWLI